MKKFIFAMVAVLGLALVSTANARGTVVVRNGIFGNRTVVRTPRVVVGVNPAIVAVPNVVTVAPQIVTPNVFVPQATIVAPAVVPTVVTPSVLVSPRVIGGRTIIVH